MRRPSMSVTYAGVNSRWKRMHKIKLVVAWMLVAGVALSTSGCVLLGALAGSAATAYGIYQAVHKK
jgi:hypothetical protein